MPSGSLVSICCDDLFDPRWPFECHVCLRWKRVGRYHKMHPELLSLIAAKEQKGEVHFLKRNDLEYDAYPGAEDPEAYRRASAWLERLGYDPLRLDDTWWLAPERRVASASWEHCQSGSRVVRNYRAGFHEYAELLELLAQSCGGKLRGTMGDDLAANK